MNLVTEVEHVKHGNEVRRTCYRFSASSQPSRLANLLKKKACCLGGKTRASLCLQKKNRRPGRSNGSRSGACALIFPLRHCRVPVLSHARCQTFQKQKVVAHELRSFL